MTRLMFQFRWPSGPITMDDFCKHFGLAPENVDSGYGLVLTDSRERLYCALVDPACQSQVEAKLKQLGQDEDPAVGFFANPPIEPFGPPQA